MAEFLRARAAVGLVLLAAITLLTLASTAKAFPTPRPFPVRWELDFEAGPMRLYVDEQGDTFWYLTYYVENNTGDEQVWAPTFTLFTDDGRILRSGEGVPTRVEGAILDLLGDPLLQTQNMVIGDLFQGEQHAKEGLVVWPAENLDVTELSVFIAGISGETTAVTNPVTGNQVVMQKTLQRDYRIPGEPLARGNEPLEFLGQRWIMR